MSFVLFIKRINISWARLMVRPGELVVIQRGLKFKVRRSPTIGSPRYSSYTQISLPDGPVRGCKDFALF